MSCHGEFPVEILSHKTKALFHPAIKSQCEGLTTEWKALDTPREASALTYGHRGNQAFCRIKENERKPISSMFMN